MTASPRFEPTPNSRDGYDDRGSLTLSPEGIITDASYAASKTLELPFDDLISKPAIPLIKSRFPEWPGPDKGVDGSPRKIRCHCL